ncbi:tail fiber domain-containing protein, partial [bacterium]|nr:tail fiber domain-containing protein [bacterium]
MFPSCAVDVLGDIKGTRVLTTSDIRVKTHIEPLSSRDLLLKLNPVSYELVNALGKKRIGLIAQEVENIIPEAVHTTSDFIPFTGEPNEGDYIKFSDGKISRFSNCNYDTPPCEGVHVMEKLVHDFKTIDYNTLV